VIRIFKFRPKPIVYRPKYFANNPSTTLVALTKHFFPWWNRDDEQKKGKKI